MENYLLEKVEIYFNEVLAIEGVLITSESLIATSKNQILKENREREDIVSVITSYRNLSILQGDNLFVPNYSYQLTTSNMEKAIKHLVSQYCGFALAQAYEVFETFLIEIITSFFFNNQEKMKLLKLINEGDILSELSIRKMIKNQQKENNKGLIWIIRKLSAHFQAVEIRNCYNVNISEWFDLISMVRHTLVHNRHVIADKFIPYLDKPNMQALFDKHFERVTIGNKNFMYLDKNKTSDVINWLNSFANTIYEVLSFEANLKKEIPQFSHINAKPTILFAQET